jgi:PIN domain nuclease of toxin-antitoxin system
LELEQLQISPAVLLDLEYLYEIKKINYRAQKIVDYLEEYLGLSQSLEPFTHIVQEAFKLKWTRDPFDRLITAQAAIGKTVLITKDENISKYYPEAVW